VGGSAGILTSAERRAIAVTSPRACGSGITVALVFEYWHRPRPWGDRSGATGQVSLQRGKAAVVVPHIDHEAKCKEGAQSRKDPEAAVIISLSRIAIRVLDKPRVGNGQAPVIRYQTVGKQSMMALRRWVTPDPVGRPSKARSLPFFRLHLSCAIVYGRSLRPLSSVVAG
jgi:hypothetical protein